MFALDREISIRNELHLSLRALLILHLKETVFNYFSLAKK